MPINNIGLTHLSSIFIFDLGEIEQDNNNFIDLMEDYFNQDFDVKLKDARPEYGYQVPYCSLSSLNPSLTPLNSFHVRTTTRNIDEKERPVCYFSQ